ncbi:MAG: CotH kinase family protein [Clostridia bacterium]|nr:CotH kinase family protein [Clostridia bacterium]
MKRKRLFCAILALVMTAAVVLPAAVSAAERPANEIVEIVPLCSEGVTLEYDAADFTLACSRMFGLLKAEEAKTFTLTAYFAEGWTYNAEYSNFFRSHSSAVEMTDGANGEKVFTFRAEVGDLFTEDELQTVGVYASAAELPKFYINASVPFSQIGKEEYVEASFSLTLGTRQFQSGDYEGTGYVKGRGNTSWGQPKKPYSIKLSSKASLLDIPKTKKYAIVPSYSDNSLIRNFMTYKACQMLTGIDYVPRCEFVEVYLNGVYNGIYILVERVSIESNKIDIDEATEDDLTGGYLIEKDIDGKIDFSADQWFNCPYWANQSKDYFVLKEPEPDDSALRQQMLSYLENYMIDLHNAVMGTSSEPYTRYVDTDSWIDFIIVQELAKNIDGNLKTSCYMIKKSQDDKLYMTAPWDFDLAYGNPATTWNNADYTHNDYYDCPDATSPGDFMVINSSCPWFDTLYDDHEEFRSALMDKYAEYRRSLVPAMLALIDSQAAYLSAAMPRDEAKWGVRFQSGVSQLKNWYASRIEWLDGQWLEEVEPIDLNYALNVQNGSLEFTTSADHPFTGTVKDGRIAGVSGGAGVDSSESTVSITISMLAGETLSFDYKVSSEENYDKFLFGVNGTTRLAVSGEHDWQSYTFTAATTGSYTFTWRYSKDYSMSSGSDCVWVDNIAYSGDPLNQLLGDVDGNGVVNSADALLLLRYALGVVTTMPHMENADFDQNGVIDSSDALQVLRYAMGR